MNVRASDDVSVAGVTVSFDLNGDGIIEAVSETRTASNIAGDTFEATFSAISGPAGPRSIESTVRDASFNLATASISVVVTSSIDGNFNDDGLYDCSDIDALVAEIATGGN